MTESEKRRRELLNSAREAHNDRRYSPAVHPRYRSIYGSLYPDDTDQDVAPSTFSLRVTVGILLFLCFVGMDYSHTSIKNMDSSRICEEITYQIDVMEVWNSL